MSRLFMMFSTQERLGSAQMGWDFRETRLEERGGNVVIMVFFLIFSLLKNKK